MKDRLLAAIENKTASVVVLGLGYVGLPVACLFAEAGFPVVGIRRSQNKVDVINRGKCPIEGREPGLAELMARVVSGGCLRATTDYEPCHEAQVVLVAVETPVDPATKKPRYKALRSALTDLGQHLSPGTMVIIESTIAPGTMSEVVQPILEETSGLRVNDRLDAGDFYLVTCPERVMPGKLLANIRGCHRVVGGMSPEAADLAVRFYRHVVQADLDPVNCLTAELVKTMENAYRDVQIAFANEMALLCENMGADVWRIRELVNKSPHRAMHLPGAGVGGHCIPKDPWLLIANAGEEFEPRLIPAARAINDGMPLHMADMTVKALQEAGVDIADAKVAVLGYAYLENSDDTRNSPSVVLVTRLRELGAEVVIHDPWVPEHRGDLAEAVQGCDAVVLMVAHDEYRAVDLSGLRAQVARSILIDGRNVFPAKQARAMGWEYCGVGRGKR
ncbi:MAG: nucleotide sugar dehydrogenase [Chloroflexota bacterium]|nr:nucleotide sugar dehydrogenase [Chloroflexota bacterium]